MSGVNTQHALLKKLHGSLVEVLLAEGVSGLLFLFNNHEGAYCIGSIVSPDTAALRVSYCVVHPNLHNIVEDAEAEFGVAMAAYIASFKQQPAICYAEFDYDIGQAEATVYLNSGRKRSIVKLE